MGLCSVTVDYPGSYMDPRSVTVDYPGSYIDPRSVTVDYPRSDMDPCSVTVDFTPGGDHAVWQWITLGVTRAHAA
jgi:hypothetical protein